MSYSHGWSLHISGSTITGNYKDQNISIHIPYSTGFGIGYSYGFTNANLILDARIEPKLHKLEASYQDDGGFQQNIATYKTFTLGGGVYATYLPFGKKNTFVKGINISASGRFWPKISSSIDNDEIRYYNTFTKKEETPQYC